MTPETIGMLIFVFAFCSLIYFSKNAIEASRSPEFKREAERFREQRRRRKAARRAR